MILYVFGGLILFTSLSALATTTDDRQQSYDLAMSKVIKEIESLGIDKGKLADGYKIYEIIPKKSHNERQNDLSTGKNEHNPNAQENNNYVKYSHEEFKQDYEEQSSTPKENRYKVEALLKPREQSNDEINSDPNKDKYYRILKEIATAKPEEQRYDEQNPVPNEGRYDTILKELATATPEVQRYDEQNPVPNEGRYDKILKKVVTAKPEIQKYNEQNPAPALEEAEDKNKYDEGHYKEEVLFGIVANSPNGRTFAQFIEIQPDAETLKKYPLSNVEDPDQYKPISKDEPKVPPSYTVPEPPSFTTRINVPPLPLSLSSVRYLKTKTPDIFKKPKIVYLLHE